MDRQLRWLSQPGSFHSISGIRCHGYELSPGHGWIPSHCTLTGLLRESFAYFYKEKADDQYEPTVTDVLMTVLNFAACAPVWLCVGMFSIYHLYLASGNSTTIEGWEKDKVATLVRRGKIREIKYPYVSKVLLLELM